MAKTPVLPKTIAGCIDAALKARAARKALQAEMDALESEEKRLKDHLINTFSKQDIDGARGKLGSAAIVHKDVPKVTDKAEFGKWMAAHDAWDCLYGRATEEACAERWADKIEIPGVEKFHTVSVRLTEA